MKSRVYGNSKKGIGGDECYAGKMGFFILFCFFYNFDRVFGLVDSGYGLYKRGGLGCVFLGLK